MAPIDADSFCRDLYPRLVGLVTLEGHERPRAEEIAQDALVKVLERWRSVSAMENPRAWAFKVALNASRSAHRRSRAERRALARLHARSTGSGTVAETATIDSRLMIVDALRNLSRRQREALLLRFFADLSLRDTAEAMRCSEGTVKALTHQGTQRLRDLGIGMERPQ